MNDTPFANTRYVYAKPGSAQMWYMVPRCCSRGPRSLALCTVKLFSDRVYTPLLDYFHLIHRIEFILYIYTFVAPDVDRTACLPVSADTYPRRSSIASMMSDVG